MSHVISFGIQMFKVTLVVSPSQELSVAKKPELYLKEAIKFFNRTNCSRIIPRDDHILISIDKQFTTTDYQAIWSILKKHTKKEANSEPIPEYVDLRFTQITYIPENLDEFILFETMVS